MTYSPGRLAFGSLLPITAHSISRASTASSTTIFRSYCAANSTACSRDFLSSARETPTDEPRFAGLTKQGRPNLRLIVLIIFARSLCHCVRRNQTYLHIGKPACRNNNFIATLSIPHAEASTPQPT